MLLTSPLLHAREPSCWSSICCVSGQHSADMILCLACGEVLALQLITGALLPTAAQ